MAKLTIENQKLYLDGREFFLASGDFHYFRTLQSGWRRRLKLMKAFGLTAVQTYVPWNLHEPEQGEFHFENHLDLHAFLQMCQEEGLYVMLRPAPYICSECDFGGLPYWLMKDKDTCIRTCDEKYLAHLAAYNERLAKEFVPMLSTNGGPILAVALENEYGCFGNDLDYINWLREDYQSLGVDVPFYTAGGPELYKQTFGGPADVWSGLDLRDNSGKAIAQWQKFQQGFPVYLSEMWGGCGQQWGSVFPRQTPETVAKNYNDALHNGAFVNFYMFCGGTNFGFFSGALHAVFRADVPGAMDRYIPFETSYDVDAPVNEAGNATEKYLQCRKVLADFRHMSLDDLPPVPEPAPVQIPEEIQWKKQANLFCHLPELAEKSVKSGNFRTMESLDQDYGWILYTTDFKRSDPGNTYYLHLDGLHDRADIYIDGQFCGTYYRDRPYTPVAFQVKNESVRIDILVENMGRINYGAYMLTDQKGIRDFARIDVKNPDGSMMYSKGIITNWVNRTLPMRKDAVHKLMNGECKDMETLGTQPRFFQGSFWAKEGIDAFVNFHVDGATRGCIWVNGFHLGRYWAIGPQDTLYIPGELLKEENTITVFELHANQTPPALFFQDHHELDSITQNAELILAPRA